MYYALSFACLLAFISNSFSFGMQQQPMPLPEFININAHKPNQLPNLVNSCYLNAALQCLYAIPEIKQFLITSGTKLYTKKSLGYDLARLFTAMHTAKPKKDSEIPQDITDCLIDVYNHIDPTGKREQGDSAITFTTLITAVLKGNQDLAQLFTFTTQTVDTYNNTTLNKTTYTSNLLLFPVSYTQSFFEALSTKTSIKEYFDDSQKKIINNVIRTVTREEPLPVYALIRIAWTTTKPQPHIPMYVNFSDFLPHITTPQLYQLKAVAVHLGSSLQSGHYVAYVNDPHKTWWLCNDAIITQEKPVFLETKNESNKHAILCIYEKQHTSDTTLIKTFASDLALLATGIPL